MLHVSKTRISLRGKHTKHVCADPRTRSPRESFPRQQKRIGIRQFRVLFQPASTLDWGFCGEPDKFLLLEESVLSWLSWPEIPAVHLSCRWDRRMVAGQKWGAIESGPGRLLPSCSTADKWVLETDGVICKPNWRRQIQWRGKHYLPSLPTDGQALHLLPSYKIHFELPVFKIPTGNGYMGIKIRGSDNKWKLKDLGAKNFIGLPWWLRW